jgi:preprotein translocase subunit SecY
VALITLFNSKEVSGVQYDPALVLLILLVYLAMIVGIVFITLAQRRIPIHMAKHVRGMRMSLGARNFLPLRVNQAGVMPVIFASVVMQFVGVILSKLSESDLLRTAVSPIASQMQRGAHFGYVTTEVMLIIFFAYFYTAMTFNPKEMADNLKKQGHFIPGIRPGKHTAEFLEKVMNRVVIAGAIFLAFIDVLPVLATGGGIQSLVARFMGGTGLLIVVGVALDLMQKLETEITMRNYQGFMKQRRNRRSA